MWQFVPSGLHVLGTGERKEYLRRDFLHYINYTFSIVFYRFTTQFYLPNTTNFSIWITSNRSVIRDFGFYTKPRIPNQNLQVDRTLKSRNFKNRLILFYKIIRRQVTWTRKKDVEVLLNQNLQLSIQLSLQLKLYVRI